MMIPHRAIAALAVCLSALLVLSVSVSAHSGGTDRDGGHHDGDDYHYHHGYPAHDHYDMDGDGNLDCPYDFDDNTGQNSGNAGSTQVPTETNRSPAGQGNQSFDPEKLMDDLWQCLAVGVGLLFVASLIANFFSKKIASVCASLACVLFFIGMIIAGILSILGWFL